MSATTAAGLAFLAFSCAPTAILRAQTASASKATSAESASSGLGFSIETEMLTYRALESNGEAIACDVAGYLHNATVSFKDAAPGAICNVTGSGSDSRSRSGVIILPFDRNVFADFQIWRSDMETMNEFERRGAAACSTHSDEGGNAGRSTRGLSSTGSAAASTVAKVGGLAGALTPAGAMLSTASGVLGLFATDHSSSPTGGTIQDQAFMDDVGRELRSVDVPVMMPSVYAPYALTSIDPARSPFLTALDKLLRTRDCLMATKSKEDPDVRNIDAFLAALSSTTTPAKSVAPQPAASGTSATPAPTAAATTTPTASAGPSHLEAVLSADGLAVRLGANVDTGQIPDNAPQHVLLVKALESGGSVSHSSSIFGSNISYSGGSVGTYALFALNGELECAGNVYDYAGFVSAKKFQQQLRDYKPDPANQVVFIRGGCRAR